VFSTAHPPSVPATCLAALEVLEEEPAIIERLWENTAFFKAGLERLGFNIGTSESPILPVMVGSTSLAMQFSDRLFDEGVFAVGIGFPIVPRGLARVRTIVTATHSTEDLQMALEIFRKVGEEMGIV
jgi:glycine C-acetyltransferase